MRNNINGCLLSFLIATRVIDVLYPLAKADTLPLVLARLGDLSAPVASEAADTGSSLPHLPVCLLGGMTMSRWRVRMF